MLLNISNKKKITYSITLIIILTLPQSLSISQDVTYYVSPNGNDNNDGLSMFTPFKTIMKALKLANPGTKIILLDGIYREDIDSVRSGTVDKPIIIEGSRNAILKGKSDNKIIELRHDYIILDGFTIDGHSKKNGVDYYKSKLIWIEANNIKIVNMMLKNANDECIRLKFASYNELSYNTITNCGVNDFKLNGGGKNGEHIYIGTAREQLKTDALDTSSNNWVHHNVFVSGGECVDIKEGSTNNIVEYNTCSKMLDADTGAINIRGNNNIIRYNEINDNKGAGIRVGGDTTNDGLYNEIYENKIYNNKVGIKLMNHPQSMVCGNIIRNVEKVVSGTYKDNYDPIMPC
ncbi:MAG: DUF1565 domain-containing protein [Candidatus Nitrosocaldaceae archaeon]